MVAKETVMAEGTPHWTRRDCLYGLGVTLGTVAFNWLLARRGGAAEEPAARASQGESAPGAARHSPSLSSAASSLAARKPHLAGRARACIFLFMEGGPSHIDTFDPKPALARLHLKEFERRDRLASAMASGKRYYVQSPYRFRQVGESGAEMCEVWEHLPRVADEICFYRGCQAQSINHPNACYHLNTGNPFGGDPALGAWVTYGLGTENENLPAFLVLPEAAYPQGGAANWSNGFLPAIFQATALRHSGPPILDLRPPHGVTAEQQQANLALLRKLNEVDLARHPHQEELAARLQTYELAFRMQAEVPELVDLSGETAATLALYGVGEPECGEFARRCLLARRLVERGVRFVQLYAGGWDSHDYLERSHRARIRAVDRPIAGLLTDLRRRGLLDETLVVWAGEFGRSPDNGLRGGAQVAGRDHNAHAMALWLAGGGVARGQVVGATDDLGATAIEAAHPLRDLHCTLLHLLGLDDNRLTYLHEGRFKQLSQIGGRVIRELVA